MATSSHVPVDIEASASLCSSQGLHHHLAVIAGSISQVDSGVEEVNEGDRVISLANIPPQSRQSITLPLTTIYPKPETMTPAEATTYTSALITAIAISTQELALPFPKTLPPTPRSRPQTGKRVLVIGGQTPLAAALTQVISASSPTTRIVLTSTMPDQAALFQRTVHLIGLGGCDAIDGAIPDLLAEMPSLCDEDGVEVIVNTVAGEAVRADLLQGLRHRPRVVECASIDLGKALSMLPLDDERFIANVDVLLRTAASEFATYHPLPQCSMAGEATDDET